MSPWPGKDEPGPREMIVLPQDQVGGEVTGRPWIEQGWRLCSELREQVTKLRSLGGVEERIGHTSGV